MAFIVDDNGEITCVQGDNGQLVLNGLPTDKNYTVYFAIQDSSRNPKGSEISVSTNQASSITITIPATLTNVLTVKKSEEFATYYYGCKLCDSDGKEDTLLLGDKQLGENNTITVYPKIVEGTT